MAISKTIKFILKTVTLTQAVSLHIKRGGTDPIVELRMHQLMDLISEKRELGYRTTVTQRVKDKGMLREALRQAIHDNQLQRRSKSQSRRRSKDSRFNRYRKFHS